MTASSEEQRSAAMGAGFVRLLAGPGTGKTRTLTNRVAYLQEVRGYHRNAMRWSEFERDAPELASIGRRSFERYELILLATIKLDGSPRLSFVTPLLLDDALFVSTRAGDAKTRDLERDSRCSIHSLVSHRTHADRAFTAEAVARPVADDVRRGELLERARRPEISWFPDAIHELDVISARSVGGAPKPRLAWRAVAR